MTTFQRSVEVDVPSHLRSDVSAAFALADGALLPLLTELGSGDWRARLITASAGGTGFEGETLEDVVRISRPMRGHLNYLSRRYEENTGPAAFTRATGVPASPGDAEDLNAWARAREDFETARVGSVTLSCHSGHFALTVRTAGIKDSNQLEGFSDRVKMVIERTLLDSTPAPPPESPALRQRVNELAAHPLFVGIACTVVGLAGGVVVAQWF